MATVVDALVVSLGLDSKEFTEGMRQATTALKDFQKDARVNLGGAMQGVSQGLSAFRAIMLSRMGWATIGGIRDMAEEMTQAQFKTYRLARAFNVNAQELAAWQKAVQVAGGSPEAFNKSIENMVANLRKVGIGLAGVRMSGFGLGLGLGVSSFGDPLKTMASLARTMHGMDMGRALVIGEKLGIDRDTIYMLRQGGAELVNLVAKMRELGSPTEEQLAKTNQLRMQMEVFKLTIERVREQLFMALAPAISAVTEKLTELGNWMKEHPKAIKYAFYGIAAAIGVATVAMTAFAIASLASGAGEIIIAISVAVGALAAASAYLFDEWEDRGSRAHKVFEPFVRAVRSLYEAFRGLISARIGAMLNMLLTVVEGLVNWWTFLLSILTGNWDQAGESFKKLINGMIDLVTIFVNFTVYQIAFLVGKLSDMLDDFVKNKAEKVGRSLLRNLIPGGGGDILDKVLESTGAYKLIAGEGGGKGKAVDITVGSVVVQSPTDKPEDLGNATRSAIEEKFREFGMSVLLST